MTDMTSMLHGTELKAEKLTIEELFKLMNSKDESKTKFFWNFIQKLLLQSGVDQDDELEPIFNSLLKSIPQKYLSLPILAECYYTGNSKVAKSLIDKLSEKEIIISEFTSAVKEQEHCDFIASYKLLNILEDRPNELSLELLIYLQFSDDSDLRNAAEKIALERNIKEEDLQILMELEENQDSDVSNLAEKLLNRQ